MIVKQKIYKRSSIYYYCEASHTLAVGVRGLDRGMQGPGDLDPGEEAREATLDACSVSAHGRVGGV